MNHEVYTHRIRIRRPFIKKQLAYSMFSKKQLIRKSAAIGQTIFRVEESIPLFVIMPVNRKKASLLVTDIHLIDDEIQKS